MNWLLTRMKYELKNAEGNYTVEEKIIDKYAKMAEIQAKIEYGNVYTIEDFIEDVESGCIIPYDGCGYYWDEVENKETDAVSFSVNELRKDSNIYHYVIWYGR